MADGEERQKERPFGLVAAVQEVLRENQTEMLEEQLALLPVPGTDRMEPGEVDLATGKRGRGRPPGAKNKSTTAWRDWILSSRRSPMEFLADLYNKPAMLLAAELKCDIVDAVRIQAVAAKELLPYLHQRLATADDGGGKPPVPLAIHVTERGAQLVAASRKPGGGVVIEGKIDKTEKDDGSST
ncbi:MAG: hypothetical protein U1A72_13375 [Sulfuritalea sp.]|nr:hypothetical protein [Sulfuritalea sp.]